MIPTPEKRVTDFENLGFGMFIHWGLYSILGKGEWAQWIYKIPKEEYTKLFDSFTAKKFNGRTIAKIAKNAGMKYITLTTRHHEGFSLYDTMGLNTFDAPHSPAGRDLIADFVEGCRAEGILPMFYHTTLDWWKDEFNNDFPTYLEYLNKSVEILCKNYGKIGGLWFDGNWSKPNENWHESELYAIIRKNQPDAMIINNTGISERGGVGNPEIDSVTFEQGRPVPLDREGMPKYVAAEMCETINAHWGIGNYDFNYKSTGQLIETLCACRKVGANYLLNVGPDAEGEIIPIQAALIGEVGKWIKSVGNSIYGGRPCGVVSSGKNFALKKDGKLYLFVHDLSMKGSVNVTVNNPDAGEGPKTFLGLHDKIKSVKWVDNNQELTFTQNVEDGYFTVNCTGYDYGAGYVVRVAEMEIDK